jgi:hypothetical protein
MPASKALTNNVLIEMTVEYRSEMNSKAYSKAERLFRR